MTMWCAVLVCWAASVVAVCGAPHIVVIIADDLGWNDVSFHGSSQIMTPNIDALAYQGVVLNRHYTLPSCSPSRASFLTGRYPVHTGVQRPFLASSTGALPLNYTLLPQYLSELGYQTHLVGKWHLGSHRSEFLPTRRGFQSHFGYRHGFIGYYDGIHYEDGMPGIDAHRGDQGAWQEFMGVYATDVFTQEAVSIVKSHDKQKGSLFLQVALSAPHTGNRGAELQVRDLDENEREHAYIADPHRRLYAGIIRGVDDAVGAILEALDSSGMLNDSIVLFTSDNGAPTVDPNWRYNNYGSNWPLRGMKLSCHEGGVRSAAALWSPLVAGGRVSDDLIHLVDWLPTLYSAAGGDLSRLGELDGVNQWETLKGGQRQPASRTEMLVDLGEINSNQAFIKWPWKLVRYSPSGDSVSIYTGESGRGSEVPEYSVDMVSTSPAAKVLSLTQSSAELLALRAQANIDSRCEKVVNNDTAASSCSKQYCLFNIMTDPCETTNLATDYPALVITLQDALDVYRKTAVPPVPNLSDPRANPSHWQNYWTTWDDTSSSGTTLLVSIPMLLCTSALLVVKYC